MRQYAGHEFDARALDDGGFQRLNRPRSMRFTAFFPNDVALG